MKNSKLTQVIMFLAGLLIGGGIILGAFNNRIFHPTAPKSPDSTFTIVLKSYNTRVATISLDTAREHFNSYYKKGAIRCDPFKFFTVNMDELWAMNWLHEQNPKLNSFRIIMGIMGDPEDMAIIVGVDSTGDQDESTVLETSREGSGPCPVICGSPDTTGIVPP